MIELEKNHNDYNNQKCFLAKLPGVDIESTRPVNLIRRNQIKIKEMADAVEMFSFLFFFQVKAQYLPRQKFAVVAEVITVTSAHSYVLGLS